MPTARQRGVDHQNCGKLIVANGDEEEQVLLHLLERAHANDVDGVRLISGTEAHKLEPEVRCTAALLCPTSGIVDQHPYMLALQGDMENAGGTLVCDCRVESLARLDDGFLVKTGGDSATEIEARFVVNSAGLGAVDLLNRIEGYPQRTHPDDAPRRAATTSPWPRVRRSSISSIRCRTPRDSASTPRSISANACASARTWSG